MSEVSHEKEIADSSKAIESAIRVIDEYNNNKLLAVGSHLRSLFHDLFNDPEEIKSDDLEGAIKTLKTNYPLLEKFQKGSTNERKLAELAISTIVLYNKKIDILKFPRWGKKISNRLLKKLGLETKETTFPKIFLPISLTSRFEEGDLRIEKKTSEVALKAKINEEPLTHEIDMFRMKGIMLLKNHEIPVKIMDLSNTPVKFTGALDKETVLLSQTLLPLPGEEIQLSGEFIRKQGNLIRSLPQTFNLLRKSLQSGFPHPIQHAGWAFSDALIPSCPLRPEKMPLFEKLLQRKNAIAIALLPRGRLNLSAKRSLELKEEAFKASKDKFLKLHETLSFAFLDICPDSIKPSHASDIIRTYFKKLNIAKNPLKQLSNDYSLFEKKCIFSTNKKLLEKLNFDKKMVEECKVEGYLPLYAYLEDIYKESLQEIETELYPNLLGKIFEQSILFILIQEASEAFNFSPPLLNLQERIVQASAFKQLISFLDECEEPLETIEAADSLLEKRLKSDIELFKPDFENTFPHLNQIINELEEYSLFRHFLKN